MDAKGRGAPRGAAPASLGARIRAAREHAEMTPEELAGHLGVEAGSLAAWESDERTPRANRLTMLAGLLDVGLPWLLEGGEDGGPGSTAPTLDDVQGDVDRLALLVAELSQGVEALQARLAELRESRR